MAAPNAVWGVDVGQVALKAIKLRRVDGQVQVEAFDVIEHPQILSQPDADREELIHQSLEQFLGRNDVAGSTVAIAVPGQSSFTRFVKLPPVEKKKVPEIVRFEAEQQIPFPIDDVIWRWQTFQADDSPDLELGIFAMKKTDVHRVLGHFEAVELDVDVVQMAPLALYNYMTFDEQVAREGATLLIDVGADKTDLVVSDGPHIWTRTIQIGGSNFTEALVRGFKLSFAKAEKLKRTAASSKYARQVFQTMRPVFSDLVQEIQRSIGYYMSTHRDARFQRVLGLGNGFRLPGLQKFLEQNLNVPVVRVDGYRNVTLAEGVNTPAFEENVLGLAVAYGLALQGLDEAEISTNLLPDDVLAVRRWSSRRPWFIAAAAVLLVALAGPLVRQYQDAGALEASAATYRQAENILDDREDVRDALEDVRGEGTEQAGEIVELIQLRGYTGYWPAVWHYVSEALERTAPDQDLYRQAVAGLGNPSQPNPALERLRSIPRSQRRLFFVEHFEPEFVPDVTAVAPSELRDALRQKMNQQVAVRSGSRTDAPAPEAAATDEPQEPQPGFRVYVIGRTPLSMEQAHAMSVQVQRELQRTLPELARRADAARRRGQPSGPDVAQLRDDLGMLRLVQVASDFAELAPAEGRRTGGYSRGGGRSEYYEEEYYEETRGGVRMNGRTGTADPAQAGPLLPDPLLPDEDMAQDTAFGFVVLLAIEDDGLNLPEELEQAEDEAASD